MAAKVHPTKDVIFEGFKSTLSEITSWALSTPSLASMVPESQTTYEGHQKPCQWVSLSSFSTPFHSPPLPDSPVLETAVQSNGTFMLSKRGQFSLLVNDIGFSPPRSTALRLSTPTQYPPRSPTSPAFSDHDYGRRSSHQATALPFTWSQSRTLVLSPLANFSRSSLKSGGSSYHT